MRQNDGKTIRKRKILIALMEYLVVLGCLITLFVMVTPKENITKTANSYAKPEEVTKYVLSDGYISRIRPLTKYNQFKEIAEDSMNENYKDKYTVKVYSDNDKNREITDGYITTGMIVEYSLQKQEVEQENDLENEVEVEKTNQIPVEEQEDDTTIDFIANVIGDITKDGDCNISELTQIIRHIVGIESLNNQEKELSADFNGDRQIDVTDVSMCINYIVYGTMEADKLVPNAPTILINGENNQNKNWYNSDVEIEIIDNEKEEGEISKTQTIVESKLEGEENKITQGTTDKEFRLNREGNYKITSQNYGSNGTRSEIIEKEVNIDKTSPEIIDLQEENIDSTTSNIYLRASDNIGVVKYKLIKDEEEKIAREVQTTNNLEERIEISENGRYTLIVEDIAGNTKEQEIEISGLKDNFTIKFQNEDGTVLSVQSYRKGEKIDVVSNPTKIGNETYIYKFIGWEPEISEVVTKDEIYTARYEAIYKEYSVKFVDDNGNILSEKSNYHYGDLVEIPEVDFSKEDDKYNYEFIGWNVELENQVTRNRTYKAVYNKIPKEYTITFLSEDSTEIIEERTFKSTDRALEDEPIPPHRDGYVGKWEEYTLRPENIEVRVYYEEAAGEGETLYYTDKNGITWSFVNENGYATNIYYDSGNINSELLEIPYSLDGYIAKRLGDSFASNIYQNIYNVKLPKTLETISNYAFNNCSTLNNIEIPSSVLTIGEGAFEGCSSLTSIEIPNVTNIGNSAFFGCSSLTGIELQNVTSIGENAFNSCSSLTDVELPNVENIERWTFAYCNRLENISCSKLASIGEKSFYGCSSLVSVDLPNVTNLGFCAFEECSSLSNIELSKVINIEGSAFYNCTSLESIELPNVTNLGHGAFYQCRKLVSIELPNVENIENWTFGYCDRLENISCLKAASIGEYTFYSCSSLENIELPNVENIGEYAFLECNKLTDIFINKSESEMQLGTLWNNNAYVHYSDCTHSIEKNIKEGIYIQDVTDNLIDGNITCRENYQFRLLNEEENIVTNEIVSIQIQGSDIRNIIKPNGDGIYTIEKVARNMIINVQDFQNNEEIRSTDENGITWQYTFLDRNAVFVHYDSGVLGETIIIPSELDGNPVVQLQNLNGNARNIFATTDNQENNTIKEIVIPNSITDIGDRAFYQCKSLLHIELPNITSIGNYAFRECSSLSNIEMPNVININGYAFFNCSNLESIEMPNVTSVGIYAFHNCSSLSSIDLQNVTNIEYQAFYRCSSLASVDLSNVTNIGSYAFQECSCLTKIELPKIENIQAGAFNNCYNLTDIYINNTKENIDLKHEYGVVHYKNCRHDITFQKYTNICSSIEEVSDNVQDGKINCRDSYQFKLLNENQEIITSERVFIRLCGEELDENQDLERMRRYFDNSSNMFTNSEEGIWELYPNENGIYTIENIHRNVTIIVGSYQAVDQNGITWNYSYEDGKATNVYYSDGELGETVEIPNSLNGYPVEKLYNKQESGNIFALAEDNTQIKNIKISDGINNIGDFAFYKLENLQSIELPNSVTSIGKAAFYKCSNLSEIKQSNSLEIIDDFAFSECINLQNIYIPEKITVIKNGTFLGCSSLKDINLENITSIGDGAFYSCNSLESIELPNAISLGEYAFSGCSSLTELEIPNATSIPYSAFNGCGSLNRIELPNVTRIENDAFYGCSSLASIDLSNVTSIGNHAFYDCSSLENIEFSNVTSIGDSTFEKCSSLERIDLPNVTNAGRCTFYNCTSLKNIEISNVTSIGDSAFYGCSDLEIIEIPNAISVGHGAFRACMSLTSVDLSNVTSMGSYVFGGCSSLVNIDIPNVTSIPYSAFNGCGSLNRIELPNVTAIGERSFYGCSSLTELDLPNVTFIGNYAFYECSSLVSLDIPNVENIGVKAFALCNNISSIIIPKCITYMGPYSFEYWTNNQSINIEAEELIYGDLYWNRGCAANIVWGYTKE